MQQQGAVLIERPPQHSVTRDRPTHATPRTRRRHTVTSQVQGPTSPKSWPTCLSACQAPCAEKHSVEKHAVALQLTAMMSTEDTTAAMRSALGRRIQGALSFHKWSPTCVSETLWASAPSSLHCQPDKWQLDKCLQGESFTLQLRTPSTASKPSKTAETAYRHHISQPVLPQFKVRLSTITLLTPQIAFLGGKIVLIAGGLCMRDCMVGSTKSFGDCKSVLIISVLAVRVDCTCPLSYL